MLQSLQGFAHLFVVVADDALNHNAEKNKEKD